MRDYPDGNPVDLAIMRALANLRFEYEQEAIRMSATSSATVCDMHANAIARAISYIGDNVDGYLMTAALEEYEFLRNPTETCFHCGATLPTTEMRLYELDTDKTHKWVCETCLSGSDPEVKVCEWCERICETTQLYVPVGGNDYEYKCEDCIRGK